MPELSNHGASPAADTAPRLRPVFENPGEGRRSWPWPIAGRAAPAFIPLGGDMSDAELGSFFAQTVDYNSLEGEGSATLLAAILRAESLILPGGLQAAAADRVIDPSCCCGLETWRDWRRFLEEGVQPWLGHDPAPWLEDAGRTIRVWSDGGVSEAPDAFAIELTRAALSAELLHAEEALCDFLARAEAWARARGFADAAALRRRLDRAFSISPPAGG
jgi:hypothetical protein